MHPAYFSNDTYLPHSHQQLCLRGYWFSVGNWVIAFSAKTAPHPDCPALRLPQPSSIFGDVRGHVAESELPSLASMSDALKA